MKQLPAVVLLLAVTLLAAFSTADEPTFKVRGRSLATVYLDAGRVEGLKAGDRVKVVAGGTTVADMEIVAVSDHAAACRVLSLSRPIRAGDVAVPAAWKPGAAARTARSSSPAAPASSSSAARPAPGGAAPAPAPTQRADGSNGPLPASSGAPAAKPATIASAVAATRPAAAGPKAPPAPSSPTPTVASTASDPRIGPEPPAKRPSDEPTPAGTPEGLEPSPPASATREPAAKPAPTSTSPGLDPDPPASTTKKTAAKARPVGTPPGFDPTPAKGAAVRPAAESSPPAPPAAAQSDAEVSPAATAPAGTRLAALSPPPPSPVPAPASEAAPARAPGPAPALLTDRGFRVKYRSASSVYLEGGRAQGLLVGDQLRVREGQTTVAELEVVYVAELSASCKVLMESRPVHAGDQAFAVARPGRALASSGEAATASSAAAQPTPASPAPATEAETPLSTSAASRAWARVRGGASFGYYRTWDQTESALDFEQRTARLDLGLDDIAGQPLSFTLRARSRQDIRARTLSTRTPADERVDRLYELALRYEPPSDRLAFEVGRIGIYRFVGIGYLDGALARFQAKPGLQVGAFGGRQVEIEGFGLEGTGGKYGAFVQLAPAGRYARGGYDVLLAYVRENAEGDVSREYFSLESSLAGGSRWSLFQRAELDLNRGWRQELTGKSHQFSNISFSGNLRVSGSSWAYVSYDGRRNYRYYRNRLVHEEIFDDLLHQGLRAGLTLAKPGGLGASAGFGMSLKESDPRHPELDRANAYSFNFGLRHSNLFSSGFSAGVDGSGFTNGYAEGGLLSAHLGWRFGRGHMLDLSYGYSLYSVTETEEDRTTQWLRLMGRAELGRRFYLLGDFEYDAGDDLEGPRGFLELGVLF